MKREPDGSNYKNNINQEFTYDQSDSQLPKQAQMNTPVDAIKTLEERARDQSMRLQETYQQNQKKNQKLFEDDSEDDIAPLNQVDTNAGNEA